VADSEQATDTMTKILRIKYIDGKRTFTLTDKPVEKSHIEINLEKLMKLKNSGKRIEIHTPWKSQPRIYYNDEMVELPYERWKLTIDKSNFVPEYILQKMTHDPRKPRREGWEIRQFEKITPSTPALPPFPFTPTPSLETSSVEDSLVLMLRKAIYNR